MRAIREHAKAFAAIVGLVLIAAGVSAYILENQRLRFPWQEAPLELKAEFQTAQAVVAGQGQTVRVAGVRIGDVADVELKDGRGVVTMAIDPQYEGLIREDATALLRPKTGLKDMFIDVEPGSDGARAAREGWTMPIQQTAPDVNPDEIFAMLDADTRDYLKLLIGDGARGLDGNGPKLREVLAAFEPTHRDLARVNTAVAQRRDNLRRLITNLNVLNEELASRGDDLAGLVDASARVMDQFAAEEANVSAAVRELPSALSETTDALGRVERFAELLGPTTQRLRPAARELAPANDALRPLARTATPLLAEDIRPFVREARPVVRDLRPSARRLAAAAPAMGESFRRLNRFFNMLAFNPKGREDPDDPARQEGYLFWLAWLQHMGANFFSQSDAHGTFRPTTLAAPCATLEQLVEEEPELEFLMMLTPVLTDSEACG